jgi:hypothetical protein
MGFWPQKRFYPQIIYYFAKKYPFLAYFGHFYPQIIYYLPIFRARFFFQKWAENGKSGQKTQ